MNMIYGNLAKMTSHLNDPVEYALPLGDEALSLNPYLGKSIQLEFDGAINCVACGRAIKKSYNQGYCFPCSQRLAECDICIVRPELCHYEQGTCREPDWAQNHCMQPHYVYLANSSGIKVGITRGTQVPTRWIDQGAHQALPIFKVTTRQQAGLLEVALKNHVADKTDWRRMLKGEAQPVDLVAKRNELMGLCQQEIDELRSRFDGDIQALEDETVTTLNYPVEAYPKKVAALNLDKTPLIEGVLQGIKGQYLILDSGVLNIRKYAGYRVGFAA